MQTHADYFSAHAAGYRRYRPHYPRALGEYLAQLPQRRAFALDCGCGTGQLTTLLAGHFDAVVAIDASAEQVAQAPPHPQVEYRVAAAEAFGLPDSSVDLITAAQAAHWFDLDAFFTEVRRVLKPSGALALLCYGVIEIEHSCNGLVSDLYSRILAPYWPAERRHVDTGYSQLPFPLSEEQTPHMSMRADWTADDLVGYLLTWSAIRVAERLGKQRDVHESLSAIHASVASSPGPISVRWPLRIRVGRLP